MRTAMTTRPWLAPTLQQGRRRCRPHNHEPQTAHVAVAGWTRLWPGLTPTPRLGQHRRSRNHVRGRINAATGIATTGRRRPALLSPWGDIRSVIPNEHSTRPRPRKRCSPRPCRGLVRGGDPHSSPSPSPRASSATTSLTASSPIRSRVRGDDDLPRSLPRPCPRRRTDPLPPAVDEADRESFSFCL